MYVSTAEKYSHDKGKELFDKVYSDITDCTSTEEYFKVKDLLNNLPSIDFYSIKTQKDIIYVVLRDMLKLPEKDDGLIKKGTSYEWRFTKER